MVNSYFMYRNRVKLGERCNVLQCTVMFLSGGAQRLGNAGMFYCSFFEEIGRASLGIQIELRNSVNLRIPPLTNLYIFLKNEHYTTTTRLDMNW